MPFNYYSLVPIGASIISFITGFIILRNNPRKELNIVWSLFLFVIALWTLGEAGIRLAGTETDAALYWHNILVVPGGGFIACFFFHFSLIFPTRHPLRTNRYLLPVIYIIMIGFYVHALVRGWVWDPDSLNIVEGSFTRESLTRMVAQEVYEINMLYIAGLTFLGIIILIQNFNKLKGSPQQSQVGIIIFATVFFLGAGFFTDVLFPIINISTMELASVGALATAITVGTVILKFRLTDIELISEKIETGMLEDWLKDYKLFKGYTYLVPEHKANLSFKLFAREVTKGAHGLILTATDPVDVRKRYKLRKTPIIWIVDPSRINNVEAPDPNVIVAMKGDIERIQNLIEQFLVKSTNNMIFLEDLRHIYDEEKMRAERQMILNASKSTFEMINEYNSRFIISLHPHSLNTTKVRTIIRTKSPILELRLLTIFILEELCQQVIDALEVRTGRESITKKLHWLKSADPFFLKMKFIEGKVIFSRQTIVSRDDLIKKVKMFATSMRSLDRSLELDPIALRILIKYGFSQYEYDVLLGNTYLVKDETGNTSFDIFQQFIDSGYEGLCISKTNPKKILERYGLSFDSDNILWLTDISSTNEKVVPPKLEHIFMEIENFIEKTKDKKIVILDGVEYLISYSGDIFNPVLGFLRKLTDKISEGNTCLLIPLNFKALNPQRISLLSRSGLEIYDPSAKS